MEGRVTDVGLQVFDFIMDSLDKYRELYQKMAQLMREGAIPSRSSIHPTYGHRFNRQATSSCFSPFEPCSLGCLCWSHETSLCRSLPGRPVARQ